jgi:hypothetical protein
MNAGDLLSFKQWFSGYCGSFNLSDDEDSRNLMLKEKHTARVCENMLNIVRQDMPSADAGIAEAVALFHDVGRFPQYAEYRTFNDSISVNHGELGARVLAGSGVLGNLPAREQEIIATSVKFHNAFRIPDKVSPDTLIFLKLVRDADKLDIWRIFFEYFSESGREDRPSAIGLGFPDTDEYSKEVLARIFNEQLVALGMLKTLNDFKLTILSWAYDLNFRSSFVQAAEDNYIDRVAATLPQTDEIRQAIEFVNKYIQKKVNGER